MTSLCFEDKLLDHHLTQLQGDIPLDHFSLSGIDRFTGGICKGRLTIISAESGLGKTTLAHSLGDEAAAKGCVVIVNTLEVPSHRLVAKSLSRMSNGVYKVADVPYRLNEPFMQELIQRYLETIAPNMLFIEKPCSSAELDSIIASIKELRNENIVMIQDYLQIMPYGGSKESLSERFNVTSSMEGLRQIANIYEAALIVISSIARSGYNKKDPGLAALSSSSFIEYAADTIIHLAKDQNNDTKNSRTIPMVATAIKNRYGSRGEALLAFDPAYATFYDRITD